MRLSDKELARIIERGGTIPADREVSMNNDVLQGILTELQTLRELAYETQNTLNIYTPKEVVEALKKWEEL